MNRIEFTQKLALFIIDMASEKESPIIDFVKRSDDEQARLFKVGLSRCDGKEKVSAHQSGKAADIYFIVNGIMDMNKERYEKWHAVWETKYGGKPTIEWDLPHFE